MGWNKVAAKLIAVRGVKEAAEIVLCQTPLSAIRVRFASPVFVEITIPVRMVKAVNPIVPRDKQTVCGMFGISRIAVIGSHFNFLIAFAITIRIAAEPKMRRFGHERAALDEGC